VKGAFLLFLELGRGVADGWVDGWMGREKERRMISNDKSRFLRARKSHR
jgi:hypothetical protein